MTWPPPTVPHPPRRVAQTVADEHLSLGPDDPLGVRVFCDGADKRSGIIADSLLY